MKATSVTRSGMPGPKPYMGWWGDFGGPPQKGIMTYTQSPFRQSPMRGAIKSYVFNGYRRIAKEFPYFIVPVVIGYTVYTWGTAHYKFLNSKAGHVAAMEKGGH